MRGEAALTLGEFGGEEVISALLDALRKDQSPEVRWRAALALSGLVDASLVGELEQALASESDQDVKEMLEGAIKQASER